MAGVLLTGADNADITPPTGAIVFDASTNLVTINAIDDTGGSGVVEVSYSIDDPPVYYVPYSGPFAMPAGVRQLNAVATDRAGNSGPAGHLEFVYLPLIAR